MKNSSRLTWLGILAHYQISLQKVSCYERLQERYHEPHRKYHTFAHVEDVLRRIHGWRDYSAPFATSWDRYTPSKQELVRALLAAFYHDAVYVLGATDNEAQSKEVFYADFYDRIPRADIHAIGEAILDTRFPSTHAGASRVSTLLHDADWGILTAPAPEYDAYAESVFLELGAANPERYYVGRKNFLEKIYSRLNYSPSGPPIENARDNMRRELSGLCKKLGVENVLRDLDEESNYAPNTTCDGSRPYVEWLSPRRYVG